MKHHLPFTARLLFSLVVSASAVTAHGQSAPPAVERTDTAHSPEAADAAPSLGPSEANRRQAARLRRESFRLVAQKKWAEAEAVLEEALSLVPGDPVNLYNLACVRARLGRRDAAMESLEQAAEAGFTDFRLVDRDPDLDSLRELPRFKSFVAKKEEWQRRAAEGVVEALRQRFGDEYLYSVDAEQKLIFATNVDEATLEELKRVLQCQAQSQHKELFEHKPDAFVTIVVPSAADYRKLMRMRNVGGIYLDGSKTLIAQRVGEVMRHEFTHALHAADRAPLGQDHAPWVSEGMGVIYEWADVGDDAVVPRGDNPRFNVAQSAARRRSLIPLDRLVKMPQAEFMSRPNLTYPQSGALIYYLRERGVLRKFYDAYKATYEADPTAATALERATGQSLGDLEESWKQWLLGRSQNDPRRGHAPFLGASLKRTGAGLEVAALQQGGPAHAGGLEVGDVIRSINGRAVRDYAAIRPAIGPYAPGKTATVKVRRGGEDVEVALKLGPPEPAPARTGAGD